MGQTEHELGAPQEDPLAPTHSSAPPQHAAIAAVADTDPYTYYGVCAAGDYRSTEKRSTKEAAADDVIRNHEPAREWALQ